ncbi:MAG: FAD-linked oxidase, partial [Cyclobacteriaceae bacterium]|nr:FAD-linked oxidase [Cyclobacteriaceae bacterium]
LRPHHFKVFMNPYVNETHYVVEVMYKKPYKIPYPDPFPVIQTSVYRDLIYLFVRIAERFPKSIPWLIKNLGNAVLPEVNETTTGTHAETFWDAPYLGPAFACSFGVDHADTSKALSVLSKLARDEGPFPGIFGMRFIRRSEATLAFSKFPMTCMIEIDGALWRKSRKLMSVTEFSRRMIEVLQASNIPFTIHWGKNSDWAFPGLVEHMYGENAVTWRKFRSALLSPEMMNVFSNGFLEKTGLSERIEPADGGLIVSL